MIIVFLICNSSEKKADKVNIDSTLMDPSQSLKKLIKKKKSFWVFFFPFNAATTKNLNRKRLNNLFIT